MLHRFTLFFVVVLWGIGISGCFFSGGVSTVSNTKYNGGVGYLSSTERNGQWEFDGPPPRVGEVTSHLMYRKMQKEAAYSLLISSKDYELSEPYPDRQRRITAIREVGTVKDNDRTQHYYEVEFVEGR